MDTTTMPAAPARERLLMDFGWRFHLGDLSLAESPIDDDPHMTTYLEAKTGFAKGAATPYFDDRNWRAVDLPHDWAVEGAFDPANNMDHGFLPAGVGWYRKTFQIPAADAGRTIALEFDGVFRNATVWLNGHRLGTHASGYTGFRYEVSAVLNYGAQNTLAVYVDAREFEGWWYEGAGIYRHVWLVKTAPVHVAPWGVFAETNLGDDLNWCTVKVHTTVANYTDDEVSCTVESAIYDPSGTLVILLEGSEMIPAVASSEVIHDLTFEQPLLWSPDAPHLYRVETTIRQNGVIVDAVQTTFGARDIRFDGATGFYLNGQPLKLKGTCNHQDHAGVGVALPDHVQEFRIRKLKEMGSNAYRCSHNPPTPELLDACDRLGMLVMDETRRMDSTPDGLAQMESIVLRDRNHPSVILWCVGNEEPIQNTDAAGRIVARMKQLIRRLDPTRPVTLAMNGQWAGTVTGILDVQGCNYAIWNYDEFHAQMPDKPVVAAENGSTVCTRGIYANDAAKGYVSAYDANHPEWAHLALDSWKAVADRPFMAGTFVWTGFDYRGEPTPYRWPCINSHFGILDVCGFPKDNFYYYQAWWLDQPVLHILPHWNWPGCEGQMVDVWVHSNCDEVELFLNGASLGRQAMARNGHLEWKVAYAPGVLLAKGYTGGIEVAAAARATTGAPARVRLLPDVDAVNANGEDAIVVAVAITDADGLTMPTANNLVRYNISPNARILGVGNGDPSSHEPDKASQRSAFNGLCQVIVQAGLTAGDIVLTAESDGLQPAELVIPARACERRAYL